MNGLFARLLVFNYPKPPPSRPSHSLMGLFIAAAALFLFGLAAPRHAEAQTYYWQGGYAPYDGCVAGVGCPSALAACQSYADDNGGASYGEYIVSFVPQSATGTRYGCAVGYHAYGSGPVYLVCPAGTYPDGFSGVGCDPYPVEPMTGKSGGGGGQLCVPPPNSTKPCQTGVFHTGIGIVGEPVDVATGNMFYQVTDYSTAGQNPSNLRGITTAGWEVMAYWGPIGNQTSHHICWS